MTNDERIQMNPLDFAVAKVIGKFDPELDEDGWLTIDGIAAIPLSEYNPSTDQNIGGRIIDDYLINTMVDWVSSTEHRWIASIVIPDDPLSPYIDYGSTRLEAAMKCFVFYKTKHYYA